MAQHESDRAIAESSSGQLRYDLLGAPSSPQAAAAPSTPKPTEAVPPMKLQPATPSSPATEQCSHDGFKPEGSPAKDGLNPPARKDEAAGGSGAAAKTSTTNLEELRWFQHRWLDKHGRNSSFKATREQLALIRRWFDSLDADGSGEVGLDELEDPLVSVGLARSRAEVQHLIQEVDVDGTGSVTFDAFLDLLYPERVRRERSRRFPPPLHSPKHRPPERPETCPARPGRSPKATRPSHAKTSAVNPVARLFENLQAGKLGDLAIPFPVLITAHRRRLLLDAHMASNPSAKRVGASVLQALEASRRETAVAETYDWRRTHFDLQLPALPQHQHEEGLTNGETTALHK